MLAAHTTLLEISCHGSFVVVGVFSDGDVSVHEDVLENYMKQKHRLIWERRKRERDSREAVMPVD